jgi:hypothetical protein
VQLDALHAVAVHGEHLLEPVGEELARHRIEQTLGHLEHQLALGDVGPGLLAHRPEGDSLSRPVRSQLYHQLGRLEAQLCERPGRIDERGGAAEHQVLEQTLQTLRVGGSVGRLDQCPGPRRVVRALARGGQHQVALPEHAQRGHLLRLEARDALVAERVERGCEAVELPLL